MITAQIIVQNELFPNTKSASINSELHGAFGVDVYQLIEIQAIDDNNSEVSTYYYRGKSELLGSLIQKWAVDDYKECKM